ncbi:MAG: hypothetical protein WD030_05865 [Pirellulales bacterium]
MNRVARNHPFVVNFTEAVQEHLSQHDCVLTAGMARHLVAGLLDALWEFTTCYAPAGDIGRFSDDDLAKAVDWPHDAHWLIDALVAAGLLARHETHRLIVSNWSQQADASCHQYVADQGILFADGELSTRQPRRNSKAGRQTSSISPRPVRNRNPDRSPTSKPTDEPEKVPLLPSAVQPTKKSSANGKANGQHPLASPTDLAASTAEGSSGTLSAAPIATNGAATQAAPEEAAAVATLSPTARRKQLRKANRRARRTAK